MRMPVVFVGHGSPMNAIEDTPWSRGWAALGKSLPRPKAIVCVSAHWYVPGEFVTGNAQPPTIHDFGGFPAELYEIQYPAPGDPELASRVAALTGAELSNEWGLDHGTWSVLRHMYPNADVPVIQRSINSRRTPEEHLFDQETAREWVALRDEGVLIMGSGNITHNLPEAFRAMQTRETETPPWAERFDAEVVRTLQEDPPAHLASILYTEDGRKNHPTPDHYLPLLYAARAGTGKPQFPIQGFDLGSLSMRCVVWE